MARSRDWDELQHVWIEWHRKTGQKIKELYVQLVDLSNYAAQLNSKYSWLGEAIQREKRQIIDDV